MLPTPTPTPVSSPSPLPSSQSSSPDPSKIHVKSWELRGDGPTKHAAYTVHLPPPYRSASTSTLDGSHDTFTTRYSWVEALRTSLANEFSLITLPNLDSKKALGSTASAVVLKRVEIINAFLTFCQTTPAIDACHVWRNVFLLGLKPGDESATLEPVVPMGERKLRKTDVAIGWLEGVGKNVATMFDFTKVSGNGKTEEKKATMLPDAISPTMNVRRTARDIMDGAKHVTIKRDKLEDIVKKEGMKVKLTGEREREREKEREGGRREEGHGGGVEISMLF